MQGHVPKFRTAIVSLVAAALAVVLGASFWPANGNEADASAADGDTPNNVEAAEFDGWLYANPETGCIDPPPRDLDLPDVVLVEPSPAPDGANDPEERMEEREEGDQVPPIPYVVPDWPNVHVEPWPACGESRLAPTVGEGPQNTDG